jgi:uncharacterized protein YdeI (YjbR/CyaY-like superfamily)
MPRKKPPSAPDIPPDFSDALKSAGLDDFFSGCTSAHRREYLKWIAEAKRPDTRAARIEKALKMIRANQAEELAHASRRSTFFNLPASSPFP